MVDTDNRPWSDFVTEVISTCIQVDADNFTKGKEISTCDCVSKSGKPTCFDERCVNYATLTECVKCNDFCQNMNLQRGRHAKLEVKRIDGKGFGLFPLEDLTKGQFVSEYVGELISQTELTRRMEQSVNEQHLYMMQLKSNTYLDARRKGSMTRHINHSCDPNCTVQVWTVKNRYRVGIFTTKAIAAGVELTFDYGWKLSSRKPTKCLCGTAKCRGYLEVLSEEELEWVREEEREMAEAAEVRRGQWMSKKDALVYLESLLSDSASDSAAATTAGSVDGGSLDEATTQTQTQTQNEVPEESNLVVVDPATVAAVDIDVSANTVEVNCAQPAKGFTSPDKPSLLGVEAPVVAEASSNVAGRSESPANSLTCTSLQTISQLQLQQRLAVVLVGKRIKVWWEGNLSYFEVNVLSYDPKARKHVICYLQDDDKESVNLFDSKSQWMFLNESVQASSIKKKKRPMLSEKEGASSMFGFLRQLVDESETDSRGSSGIGSANSSSNGNLSGISANLVPYKGPPSRQCKYFASPAGCSYGSACTFAHGPVNPSTTDPFGTGATGSGDSIPPPPPPPMPPTSRVMVPISVLNTVYYYGANSRMPGWTAVSDAQLRSLLSPESWCQLISAEESYVPSSRGISKTVMHETLPSRDARSSCQAIMSRLCTWFNGLKTFDVKVISVSLCSLAPGAVMTQFADCDALPTLCEIHTIGNPSQLGQFETYLSSLAASHRDTYRHMKSQLRRAELALESAALTVDWSFHSSVTLALGEAHATQDSLFQLATKQVAVDPNSPAAVMKNYTKVADTARAVTKGYYKGTERKVVPREEESHRVGFACSKGTVRSLGSKLCSAITCAKLELIVRANTAPALISHCLTLLYRLLSLEDSSVVGNSVCVLSAIIMLVMKVRGEFKPKYLSSIVAAVHERAVGESIDDHSSNEMERLRSRTLSMEASIFHKLQYDIYAFDLPGVLSLAGGYSYRYNNENGSARDYGLSSYALETGIIDGNSLHCLLLFLYPTEVMALSMHTAVFAAHLVAAIWNADRTHHDSSTSTSSSGLDVNSSPSAYFTLVFGAAVRMHRVSAESLLEATMTLLELLVMSVASVHPVLRQQKQLNGGATEAPNPNSLTQGFAQSLVAPGEKPASVYDTYQFNARLLKDYTQPSNSGNGSADLDWLRTVSKSLAVHYHKACKHFNNKALTQGGISVKEIRCLADPLTKLCVCLGGGSGGVGAEQTQTAETSTWFDTLKRLQLNLGRWVDTVQGEEVLHTLLAHKLQVQGDTVTDSGAHAAEGMLRKHPLCRDPVPVMDSEEAAAAVVADEETVAVAAAPSTDSLKMAALCNHSSNLLNVPLATEAGAQRFASIANEHSWNQLNAAVNEGTSTSDDLASVSAAAATEDGPGMDAYGCVVLRAELVAVNCESVWQKLKPTTSTTATTTAAATISAVGIKSDAVVAAMMEGGSMMCLCRPWPSPRLLQREARRVEKRDREAHPEVSWEAIANDFYGLSTAALEELSLLQSLHFTAPGRSHPNIVLPVGIVREDIYYGESEETSDGFTSIDGEGRTLPYYVLTPKVYLSLPQFLTQVGQYLHQYDSRMQQLSRRNAEADERFSVGAMRRHIANVLHQLCFDLFKVIQHCCVNGVIFRYTALEEQVYVSEQGRLIYGSFAGAGTMSPGINSMLYTTAAPPLQSSQSSQSTHTVSSGKGHSSSSRSTASGKHDQQQGSNKRQRIDNIAHLQRLQSQSGALPAALDPSDKSKEILTAANDFMFKQALYPTTSLECVLGGSASVCSTIYALGSACGHILSAATVNPTKAVISAMHLETQQQQPQKVKAGSSTVREYNNHQVAHLTRYLHSSPVVGDSGMYSSGASGRAVVRVLQELECPYAGLFPLAELVEHREPNKLSAHQSGFAVDLRNVPCMPLLFGCGGNGDTSVGAGQQVASTLASMCDLFPEQRCRIGHQRSHGQGLRQGQEQGQLWELFNDLASECKLFADAVAPARDDTAVAYEQAVLSLWSELQAARQC